MRIYFDNSVYVKTDAVTIRIYESSSLDGTYHVIDNVRYNPEYDYVDTTLRGQDGIWYKISYIDSHGVESVLSEAVLGEEIQALIFSVRESLGDINLDDPAFSDTEYIQKIKAASKRHLGTEVIIGISEGDIEIISKLVLSSCCFNLAYDNARYTKITLPDGISLDKGARVAHYLAIAKSIEDYYKNVREDLSISSDEIKVIDVTKKSYFKGFYRRF